MGNEKKYRYPITPVADEKAMVRGEKYRFTILTDRLIRMEYSESGCFEDRATQTVINRQFQPIPFSVHNTEELLTITTEQVELTYYVDRPFSINSLSIRYVGKNSSVRAGGNSTCWRFHQPDTYDDKGTARTLDKVDGACELESGIISYGPITTLDDSKSLIICEDGGMEPRRGNNVDLYLFCYGDSTIKYDAKGCLKDYYKLTGKTPLLPRYTLGNWWSRCYTYTQEEYKNLMKRFKEEEIPFSVAVIDMAWHPVRIDPKYGTGWTGYTWNKSLFPDHKAFLDFLHNEGMMTTLNLHPQEGVGAHEDAYENMAKDMGMDPEREEMIPFAIEDPKFLESYFTRLHHPLEKEGVDFWWIDWQQGNTTSVPGLDPLWMLNHFHYIDSEKEDKRGMIFSRYAGPGSHRYPIGFSGDTHVTWASLDFQPYFTATASNIGYGWWSHDIGGHAHGYRDEELTARWFQLGVFSPINRLHSSHPNSLGKEPWRYQKIAELSMKKFLQLRHELIPYLYTMNYRAHAMDEPLVQPLYYNWTGPETRAMKNEYTFGTEMLVSPITSPADKETKMGRAKTYLPKGVWYDFFNHRRYRGGRTVTMFRDLYEMPVLVKSGGIIPMAKLNHVNDIENPKDMKIKVFSGADNTFELYEDDGITKGYQRGESVVTKMELVWGEDVTFTISAPQGMTSLIPKKRNFELEFVGIDNCTKIAVTENGVEKSFSQAKTENSLSVVVEEASGELVVSLKKVSEAPNNTMERLYEIIETAEQIPNDTKNTLQKIVESKKSAERILRDLMELSLNRNLLLAFAEILMADQ